MKKLLSILLTLAMILSTVIVPTAFAVSAAESETVPERVMYRVQKPASSSNAQYYFGQQYAFEYGETYVASFKLNTTSGTTINPGTNTDVRFGVRGVAAGVDILSKNVNKDVVATHYDPTTNPTQAITTYNYNDKSYTWTFEFTYTSDSENYESSAFVGLWSSTKSAVDFRVADLKLVKKSDATATNLLQDHSTFSGTDKAVSMWRISDWAKVPASGDTVTYFGATDEVKTTANSNISVEVEEYNQEYFGVEDNGERVPERVMYRVQKPASSSNAQYYFGQQYAFEYGETYVASFKLNTTSGTTINPGTNTDVRFGVRGVAAGVDILSKNVNKDVVATHYDPTTNPTQAITVYNYNENTSTWTIEFTYTSDSENYESSAFIGLWGSTKKAVDFRVADLKLVKKSDATATNLLQDHSTFSGTDKAVSMWRISDWAKVPASGDTVTYFGATDEVKTTANSNISVEVEAFDQTLFGVEDNGERVPERVMYRVQKAATSSNALYFFGQQYAFEYGETYVASFKLNTTSGTTINPGTNTDVRFGVRTVDKGVDILSKNVNRDVVATHYDPTTNPTQAITVYNYNENTSTWTFEFTYTSESEKYESAAFIGLWGSTKKAVDFRVADLKLVKKSDATATNLLQDHSTFSGTDKAANMWRISDWAKVPASGDTVTYFGETTDVKTTVSGNNSVEVEEFDQTLFGEEETGGDEGGEGGEGGEEGGETGGDTTETVPERVMYRVQKAATSSNALYFFGQQFDFEYGETYIARFKLNITSGTLVPGTNTAIRFGVRTVDKGVDILSKNVNRDVVATHYSSTDTDAANAAKAFTNYNYNADTCTWTFEFTYTSESEKYESAAFIGLWSSTKNVADFRVADFMLIKKGDATATNLLQEHSTFSGTDKAVNMWRISDWATVPAAGTTVTYFGETTDVKTTVSGNNSVEVEAFDQTLFGQEDDGSSLLNAIYVSANGSDDNIGSVNAPVQTFKKAVEKAKNLMGDSVIYVMGTVSTAVNEDATNYVAYNKMLTVKGYDETSTLEFDGKYEKAIYGIYKLQGPTTLENLTITSKTGYNGILTNGNELVINNCSSPSSNYNIYVGCFSLNEASAKDNKLEVNTFKFPGHYGLTVYYGAWGGVNLSNGIWSKNIDITINDTIFKAFNFSRTTGHISGDLKLTVNNASFLNEGNGGFNCRIGETEQAANIKGKVQVVVNNNVGTTIIDGLYMDAALPTLAEIQADGGEYFVFSNDVNGNAISMGENSGEFAINSPYSANITDAEGNVVKRVSDTFSFENSGSYFVDYYNAGDINADGLLDIRDLVAFKKEFAKEVVSSNPQFDISYDGVVDTADLASFQKHFLKVAEIKFSAISDLAFDYFNDVKLISDDIAKEYKENIYGADDSAAPKDVTTYYVSSLNADSQNLGTEADPFTSIEDLNDAFAKLVNDSDTTQKAVLFERGSVFRTTEEIVIDGYTYYGAYGTGDKPQILGSLRDYADDTLWTTENGYIWKLQLDTAVVDEAANIYVTKDGVEGIADRKITLEEVARTGDYYYDLETGMVYLFCDFVNPGIYFDTMEISTTEFLAHNYDDGGISLFRPYNTDFTIENITFKFAGKHAMAFTESANVVITNCEIGWAGGALTNSGTERMGNGIELWNSANNATITNNHIYQVYDAAVTYQGKNINNYQDITITNNLIEKCSFGFEFWGKAGDEDDVDVNTVMTGILFDSNVMRLAAGGFGGVCRSNPNVYHYQSFIQPHGFNTDLLVSKENFDVTISYNTFDTSYRSFLYGEECTLDDIYFEGNSYYQTGPAPRFANNEECATETDFEDAAYTYDEDAIEAVWVK